MATDIISYGYAAVVLTGGVIGYVKAGSAMSLMMGVLFAAFIGYGAYRTSNNPKDFVPLLIASGVLLGVMGYRFSKSFKFMPAGLVAALSLAQVLRLAYRMFA
jgi:uncharacterized membrane protein (UPF0136 family)